MEYAVQDHSGRSHAKMKTTLTVMSVYATIVKTADARSWVNPMLTDAQKRAVEAMKECDAAYIGREWACIVDGRLVLIKDNIMHDLLEQKVAEAYRKYSGTFARLVKEV